MTMRRSDRRNSSDDNAINNLRSRQPEPTPRRELEQRLVTVLSQRDDLRKEKQEIATQLVHIQQQVETIQDEAQEFQRQSHENHQLYYDEQQKHQQTLSLYTEEQARSTQLLVKYEEANTQREQYLIRYQEAQEEIKYLRHSKAGIKGWETRRKQENERLKQEIGEMTRLLKNSLERKDEAVNNLYILAERMDRIQKLIDLGEEVEPSTPIALLQKFKRIWIAIREIIAE